MKGIRVLCAITAALICVSLFSCGKKEEIETDKRNETGESDGATESSMPPENSPSDDIGTKETPEIGVSSGGVYTDDGDYIPADTVDGKDVIFSGNYDENKGVTETPAASDKKPDGNASSPTQPTEPPKVEPPKEDIYKKALDSLGSYTADISFCYYVDMDDGWHERHPSKVYVSYDSENDSYKGGTSIGGNEYAAYYENGRYTAPNGEKTDTVIDVFFRQCNYVTPLPLSSYNFEMTEDVTVVSTRLSAADYRYKLLMASNFFSGYESETNTNITMGELFYSARISAGGKLLSTKYEYTFTNASKSGDMYITAVIDTIYE